MKPIVPLALLAALALQGCLAKTALDVVTLPVRAGAKAVDLATTSQSEADENRGRELRRREERLGKLERRYADEREDCEDGDRRACDKARETYAEIQRILPTVPYEPED
tara:strand:- start:31 stop:357 length:327 start_codon:yes stop_codon:yes gene_type:complete